MLVYAQPPGHRYRLVLDDYGFPGQIEAAIDGTITLASHETVEIIDQATYVWNGEKYVFSPERSHRYDAGIGQGRPYVARVRFTPGASSMVLTGSITGGFGDELRVRRACRAARDDPCRQGLVEQLSVRRLSGHSRRHGHTGTSLINSGRTWSGTLPTSGTWNIDVFGADTMNHETVYPYALVLTIH